MEWRLAAGKRTSNALIPIVGDEAVNAEDHIAICGEEEPTYRRNKTEYAQRERQRGRETERQRERGTKNISYSYKCTSYKLEQPTFTKGYKVTLYSD